MPTIDLPHGTVRYRVAGPENPAKPPVVFVHGLLVNSTLWTKTADALAADGTRSYAGDWPLGSHQIALNATADQSPRGVARQVAAFIEALELTDVTLVGNDTGGAICQFVLDTDASRIGRVVLTNCDAFDNFPPAAFSVLFKSFRSPSAIRVLMAPLRATAIRHSPAGFGMLVNEPLDPEQTRAWVMPCLTDPAIRRDVARFAQAVDRQDLDGASKRLSNFSGPALLVWGTGDRFFKPSFAHRLRDAFSDARLVEIDGGRTFVPHDEPARLAKEIAQFNT
ncbi:MAG TPA: alpha/beta hydrolase [Solirubrobacteraceae bacterium]|jgi:pimeloyl-ACP methyl ester carboxylesterase